MTVETPFLYEKPVNITALILMCHNRKNAITFLLCSLFQTNTFRIVFPLAMCEILFFSVKLPDRYLACL